MGELTESRSPWVPETDRAWCDACGEGKEYDPVEAPDAEFPMLRWARCRNCGGETIIAARQLFWRVGRGAAPDFRVGGYASDPSGEAVEILWVVSDRRQRPAGARAAHCRIRHLDGGALDGCGADTQR
jgi:hypothetical protein